MRIDSNLLSELMLASFQIVGYIFFMGCLFEFYQHKFFSSSKPPPKPKPRRYRVRIEDDDGWPLRSYALPPEFVASLVRHIEQEESKRKGE